MSPSVTYQVRGLREAVEGTGTVTVLADGRPFRAPVRIDTRREADYHRHGAILPYVLRRLCPAADSSMNDPTRRERARP